MTDKPANATEALRLAKLKLLPPARPAVGIRASARAVKFATATIEAAIACGWSKKQRAVLFADILAHCLAAYDDDGKVCNIIVPGEP